MRTMMRSVVLLSALALAALLSLPAQAAYPDTATVMRYEVTDATKLLVLNGRLGSRELFALRPGTGTAEVGALGFDMMSRSRGERQHSREYGVHASINGLNLYPSGGAAAGLVTRDLRLGFTFACVSGTVPEGKPGAGLVLEHCVVSPADFPRELTDVEGMKAAIAPFFYHLVTVRNPGTEAATTTVEFGLSPVGATPVGATSRSRLLGSGPGGPSHIMVIALPEPAGNRYSKTAPDQALAAETEAANGIFKFTLSAPAGGEARAMVVQAAFTDDPVIRKQGGRSGGNPFYYTRFWKSVEDVLDFALENQDDLLARTAAVEARLTSPALPAERRWFMALTYHTWLCNTWLVDSGRRNAEFYVWEGEFGMLSTIDVAHEVEVVSYFMPWMLRLQLEEWMENNGKTEWGRRIFHDVGRDQVSGFCWYERPQVGGLPPMPVEENSNYALLLFWYDHISGDRSTVRRNLHVMEDMLLENLKRDLNGNGIADRDTGTTYDLSDAIHTAPDNVYLGIKQMNAYLTGADLLARYGFTENVDALRGEARKILATLKKAHADFGRLPVSLDRSARGWDQYSIALGDGLLYPSLTGFRTPEIDELIGLLKADFPEALARSRKPHAVLLSDGEPGTFFSKVMVMEPVATYAYSLPTELWPEPYRWNLNNAHAYNDGVKSPTEDWEGYKYPRGVVSLWPLLPGPGK